MESKIECGHSTALENEQLRGHKPGNAPGFTIFACLAWLQDI